MRKYLFMFIGLMFTMNVFSQTYYPVPTDSVWWVESSTGQYMGGPCVETRYDYIYPANDLVIQDKTYTEFHARTVIQYSYFGPPPSTSCPSNGIYPDHIYAFIRNDSTNKKVYLYDSSSTHSDILLYDFDITTGDTVTLLNGYGYGCSSDTFTVFAIDSFNIGGEYRQRYQITTTITPWVPIYLIEGIGSNYGFAYNMYCPFELTSSLVCYHYKQFAYGNVSSSYCTETLNIDDLPDDITSILKRTALNQFQVINTDNSKIEMTCYDMLGKHILNKSFYESAYLDFNSLTSGVYFLNIYVNGKPLKPYKFVISH